jgi:hypothetical protein
MINPQDNDTITQEFNMLMARSGVVVPSDRKAGAIIGYQELKRMTALLYQPRTFESEPSNTYSLQVIIRSISL